MPTYSPRALVDAVLHQPTKDGEPRVVPKMSLLSRCDDCAALVATGDTAAHDDWHARIRVMMAALSVVR